MKWSAPSKGLPNLKCVLWLMIVPIGVMLTLTAEVHAIELDAIAEECAEQARAVDTMEYEILGHQNDYRCFHDGLRFRVELFRKANGLTGTSDRIMAYDSTEYSEIHKNGVVFTHGTKPMMEQTLPVSEDPTLVMYYWLLAARRSFARGTICNADAWREVLASGEYVGDVSVNGVDCRQVNIAYPYARTDVYFAKDHRSYPMRWSSYTKVGGEYELRSEAEVKRFTVRDTEMGELLIPLETTFLNAHSPIAPGVARSSTLVETSLKVNQPVDVDLFTLVPIDTTVVVDRDEPPIRKPHSPTKVGPDRNSRRTWFILFNVILVAALSLALIVRARAKSRAEGRN